MRKTIKATDGTTMRTVMIRNYEASDFGKLIDLQAECFPPPYPSELWWNEAQLTEHVTRFPDGAICAEIDGRIVGSMTALRIRLEEYERHDWSTISDNGYIRTHQPDGETLYVIDLCVSPAFRRFGLGKWLMQSMYETVVHLGCDRLLGGGRMPGYGALSDRMTAEEYLEQVVQGKRKDPVITFLLRCGRMPAGVVPNYLEDEQSADYAALMEWRNPFKR
ncbi:GNAT family N-acetyltransferase [Cohnella panacarvi]|uniref:GNAT family N-acetyltransferase n=1 Tax=Cohnella panacarvi TaxID=400776 RepID=UPI00047DB72B|nr:GNAT family N-acetyltransferase [Cohnella panacarvi]